MEDLVCPITLEYLERPVTLPCCGKAVSKQPLLQCHANNPVCPLCRQDLSNIDINSIPISVNLAYLVERAQTEAAGAVNPPVNPPIQSAQPVSITINKMRNTNTVYKTVIGQMKISGLKISQHLILLVVDKSGSMAGNPMINVRYSLHRMLDAAYKNPHLVSHIVCYDNLATSFEIDTAKPLSTWQAAIDRISGSGGTSFLSAFDEIDRICRTYANNKNIGNISIVFLTDGEDNAAASERGQLVDKFKQSLLAVVNNIPFTVHSIGFGGSHDFNFLNKLKDCGTVQGAYRYADPAENTDILSSKINSILDVLVATNNVNVKVLESNVPIIAGENDTYWVNLTKIPDNCEFTISTDTGTSKIVASIVDSDDTELWNKWYSHLIDNIATEIMALSEKQTHTLDTELHFELVRQRATAIMARCGSDKKNSDRLEKLLGILTVIKNGGTVDKLKILDMTFEGKFGTTIVEKPVVKPSSVNPHNIYARQPVQSVKRCVWNPINRPARKWSSNTDDWLYNEIVRGSQYDAASHISTYDSLHYKYVRLIAAYGKIDLVKQIIDIDIDMFCGDAEDDNGYNACDLAILYGYWISTGLLLDSGFRPCISGEQLLMTCLDNGYYKTAELLIERGIVTVTPGIVAAAPKYEYTSWLTTYVKEELSIETLVDRGMLTEIRSKIDTIQTLSWQQFCHLMEKPSDTHIKIFDLLIENNKLDVFEVFETDDNDIAWPMFIACKYGSTKLFDLLIEYQTDKSINMQNKKGTTALWIGAYGKHTDIVMSLLLNGADPNMCNHKGDSALIPAIQKNSDTIVKLLLESGIDLSAYNKNRDTPIIICCRLGQHKILEILLNYLSADDQKSALTMCADIDGFNPLLAAAEQDRITCIRICCKFGADLEFRTQPTNNILPNATALHIAAYYGKLSSIQTLAELGADTGAVAIDNLTILHIAIKQKQKHLLRYLFSTYPQLVSVPDTNGLLPISYARMTGNEDILDEFFNTKLESLMTKLMFADNLTESACVKTLAMYGESVGCYEFDNIANIEIDSQPLTVTALLLGRNTLANHLVTKNTDVGDIVSFWMSYRKNGVVVMGNINDTVRLMLDRVHEVSKSGLQNKMLMDFSTGPKMLKSDKPNLIQMMTIGSDTVGSETLGQLKTSTKNISLIGFLEKIKNSKIFPDGKDCLEYIVWNAKVNMIQLIACGEQILQPVHLMAIYLFSSNMTIYNWTNITVNKWAENEIWHPFVRCLYSAIELCPIYVSDKAETEVYRAVDIVFDKTKYAIGNKITGGFILTSSEWGSCTDLVNRKRGMIFIIKSKTGRNISPYSKYPINKEVVFLPGTEFVVGDIYVGNLFALGQANIRKTSYKASEIDIAKAVNREINIMIEIEEI